MPSLADVCAASDVWCTGWWCSSLAVWVWLCWFVGGFDCAVAFVVLGDAGPLLLSPRNTTLLTESTLSMCFPVSCHGCFRMIIMCRCRSQPTAWKVHIKWLYQNLTCSKVAINELLLNQPMYNTAKVHSIASGLCPRQRILTIDAKHSTSRTMFSSWRDTVRSSQLIDLHGV